DCGLAGDPPDLPSQVDDEPLGGLLAHTGRSRERRCIARRDGRCDLGRTGDRQDRHRSFRPDTGDTDHEIEQRELLTCAEAVTRLRILAHYLMRMQKHLVATWMTGH